MTTENSQWKCQQKISQFQAGNSKPVGEATEDIDMVLIVIIMPCFSFCLVAMNRWVVVPSKKQCRSYIHLSSLHFTSMLPTHIQEWQQLPQLAPKTFPLIRELSLYYTTLITMQIWNLYCIEMCNKTELYLAY